MSHLRVIRADGVFRDQTVTPLGAGGSFVGTSEDMRYWAFINVLVNSDQAGTLFIEGSLLQAGPFTAGLSLAFPGGGQARTYSIAAVAPFMRARYVNGATPQVSFVFVTRFATVGTKWSQAPLNQAVVGDDDAELVKAVITGQNPDGTFVNIQATENDALEVGGTGIISTNNSRSPSTLLGGATWTGVFEEMFNYAVFSFNIYSSAVNRTGLLHVDLSMDGVTTHRTLTYIVANSNGSPPHMLVPTYQFFRLRFVADAPTPANDHPDFTVQTIFHGFKSKGLVSRLNDALTDSNDVENVRAVITGKDPTNVYRNIGTEQYVDGEYNLRVDMTQNIYIDPANSSTTNLAAGNAFTFTGSSISILGVGAIQAVLFADQRCLVRIQQSQDGVNWDIDDVFNVEQNTGFSTTVQTTAQFYRVIVTTNAATTTVFRLQSLLTPVMEPLPRRLDFGGNLKVSIQGDTLSEGPVALSSFQEFLVTERVRIVGQQFDGAALDTSPWQTAVAGTGAVTASGTQVTLSTGGTASGAAARIWSVRRARYMGGHPNKFATMVQLGSTGIANVRHRWGAVHGAVMPTFTNGAYFQLDGTTFSIVTRKGGVDTVVSSGSFNGQLGYAYALDTNAHIYEISLGNFSMKFFVDHQLLHEVSADAATLVDTLNLHLFQDIENTGIAASTQTASCRTMVIARLGPTVTQPAHYFHAAGTTAGIQLKASPGNLHHININSVANNATITLYDAIGANTSPIWTSGAMSANANPFSIPLTGIQFDNGLWFVVSGAAAGATIVFE